jgi:hypothetical protein
LYCLSHFYKRVSNCDKMTIVTKLPGGAEKR